MKKDVSNELDSVTGGYKAGERISVVCSNCHQNYTSITAKAYKTIDDGCDSYDEYQCPNCDTWNRY